MWHNRNTMIKKIISLAVFLILFGGQFLIFSPVLAQTYEITPKNFCENPSTLTPGKVVDFELCGPSFKCCFITSGTAYTMKLSSFCSGPSSTTGKCGGWETTEECCRTGGGESSTATQTGDNTVALNPASSDPGQFPNPLCGGSSSCSPQILIGYVVNAILGIVGSIALIMFVYGGFKWMMSGGNSKTAEEAQQLLMWATLGLVVIFSSYALVKFVLVDLIQAK
jgi:hypothetical protein